MYMKMRESARKSKLFMLLRSKSIKSRKTNQLLLIAQNPPNPAVSLPDKLGIIPNYSHKFPKLP